LETRLKESKLYDKEGHIVFRNNIINTNTQNQADQNNSSTFNPILANKFRPRKSGNKGNSSFNLVELGNKSGLSNYINSSSISNLTAQGDTTEEIFENLIRQVYASDAQLGKTIPSYVQKYLKNTKGVLAYETSQKLLKYLIATLVNDILARTSTNQLTSNALKDQLSQFSQALTNNFSSLAGASIANDEIENFIKSLINQEYLKQLENQTIEETEKFDKSKSSIQIGDEQNPIPLNPIEENNGENKESKTKQNQDRSNADQAPQQGEIDENNQQSQYANYLPNPDGSMPGQRLKITNDQLDEELKKQGLIDQTEAERYAEKENPTKTENSKIEESSSGKDNSGKSIASELGKQALGEVIKNSIRGFLSSVGAAIAPYVGIIAAILGIIIIIFALLFVGVARSAYCEPPVRDKPEIILVRNGVDLSTDRVFPEKIFKDCAQTNCQGGGSGNAIVPQNIDNKKSVLAQLTDVDCNVKSLIQAFSEKESNGDYDIVFGGSRFDLNSKPYHPDLNGSLVSQGGVCEIIEFGPNAGDKSCAAGKYQFITTTWCAWARGAGIPVLPENQWPVVNGQKISKYEGIECPIYDFSPQMQERAVIWALENELEVSINDLKQILTPADMGNLISSKNLASVWTSLPGGIESTSDNELIFRYFENAKKSFGCSTTVANNKNDINLSSNNFFTEIQDGYYQYHNIFALFKNSLMPIEANASGVDYKYIIDSFDGIAFRDSNGADFGPRDSSNRWDSNSGGVDVTYGLGNDSGDGFPLFSLYQGEVVEKIPNNGRAGNDITIFYPNITFQHDNKNYTGVYVQYYHLNSFVNGVEKGTKLKQGQLFATQGGTGTVDNFVHTSMQVFFNPNKTNPTANEYSRSNTVVLEDVINPNASLSIYKKLVEDTLIFIKNNEQAIASKNYEGANNLAGINSGTTLVSNVGGRCVCRNGQWVLEGGPSNDTVLTTDVSNANGQEYILTALVMLEVGPDPDLDLHRLDVVKVMANRVGGNYLGKGTSVEAQAFADGQFAVFFSEEGIDRQKIKTKEGVIEVLERKKGLSKEDAENRINTFLSDLRNPSKVADASTFIGQRASFRSYQTSDSKQRGGKGNWYFNESSDPFKDIQINAVFPNASGGVSIASNNLINSLAQSEVFQYAANIGSVLQDTNRYVRTIFEPTNAEAKNPPRNYAELEADKAHLDFVNKIGLTRYDQYKDAGLGDGNGTKLQAEAQTAFNEFKAEIQRITGLSVEVLSGYRSYDTQIGTFFSAITNVFDGTNEKEATDDYNQRMDSSAPPGFSEHSTGYAFDYFAPGIPSTSNLDRNNWPSKLEEQVNNPEFLKKFGLELSYPKNSTQGAEYEPWHLRFVGKNNENPIQKYLIKSTTGGGSNTPTTTTTSSSNSCPNGSNISNTLSGPIGGTFKDGDPNTNARYFPIGNLYEGPGPQQSFGACRIGGSCPHQGLDLTPPATISDAEAEKLPIYSYKAGVVEEAYDLAVFRLISIKHVDGTSARYLHNSKIFVKKGDNVLAGQTIAYMGGAGATGLRVYPIHLHIELRDKSGNLIDPAKELLNPDRSPRIDLFKKGVPLNVGPGL
jgi:murein DD-endopeptidase MepM/ murein hydrolase activator NlpD/LAS superfamily LD-carboxypeptidase LdcB/muramidase (phage lysozyme)